MKKHILKITALLTILIACENNNSVELINFKNNFILEVENDFALADTISRIKIIAEFPKDFNTENDNKVKFVIHKSIPEEVLSEILLTDINGINKKVAEVSISNNQEEEIIVEAITTINSINISKETKITFKKALLDSINLSSSSLLFNSNSFQEIELTVELIRKIGVVSKNSFAETKVIDTLGLQRGIFNNYKNIADENGKIINKFTLGNDSYQGNLYVIATGLDKENNVKTDTITLYSN